MLAPFLGTGCCDVFAMGKKRKKVAPRTKNKMDEARRVPRDINGACKVIKFRIDINYISPPQ